MEDELKESGLPWTGERYLPSVNGVIQLEHVHRYLIAREIARNLDVLDLASGEGYGSAMLAEVARSVVGVDNSPEAIAHAERTYIEQNLEYKLGSCEAIPLPDSSIDLVVSFETIEHHDQHEAMMLEIKRVLRPDGVLLISSPDKYEYSIVTNYQNPYHVKELFRQEFEHLLSAYFHNITYFGQRVVSGSAIYYQKNCGSIAWFQSNQGRISCDTGIPRPVYLIAVASERETPALPCGILVPAVDEINKGFGADMGERSAELSRTRAERDALLAECADAKAELAELYRSVSWRISRPIRWAEAILAAMRSQVGRIVRRAYELLPLSMDAKLKLKSHVFLMLGPLIKSTRSYQYWLKLEKKQQ